VPPQYSLLFASSAGLACHLGEAGIVVMEVEGPSAGTGAATTSPTQETPKAPPGQYWMARRLEHPRVQMSAWR
jgi:hypothetical protein